MSKYRKPLIDTSKLKSNPFVFGLEIPVIHYEDRYKYVMDFEGILTNEVYSIDHEKGTKVYVSSERRKLIAKLTPNACKLLKWVEQELDYNSDWFWLNKDRYMDESAVAYNTYKKSIMELQVNSFLSKTAMSDVFWLNPHYFFFGNRVKKYENNLKVVKNNGNGEF